MRIKKHTPWFTINYLTKDRCDALKSTRMLASCGIVICRFKQSDDTDENWKELCDELVRRNHRIKYDKREFTNIIRTPQDND